MGGSRDAAGGGGRGGAGGRARSRSIRSDVYGALGAGNGNLMLAAMGLLGISDIHRANGLKNFLGLALNLAAIAAFVISRLVYWPYAIIMAAGAIAGGYFGASVARRLGRTFVRRAVVLIGFAIGLLMLWRTFFAG